jgi:biopolymer transport protein ExbD/biopolymer transport protein TolR
MKRSRRKSLNQEMNLTNMIDVVFAILIVFLISAPLMSQGIKVDLPNAEAPTLEQKKMLKISITKDEKIFIGDDPVHIDNFNEIFKARLEDEMPVVINADEAVNYGLVMKIVSLAQVAGVKQLGFLTLDREEKTIEIKNTRRKRK